MYRESMFSHCFLCLKFYCSSSFFPAIHPILLIPFSINPVVTSCTHEFRGLPFLLRPGGLQKLFKVAFLHVTIPVQLFIPYVIKHRILNELENNQINILYTMRAPGSLRPITTIWMT